MNLPALYPLADAWSAPEALIPEVCLSDPFGEGARALRIASLLKITEGPMAGETFGNVMTEWQRRLILALWGYRDEQQRRIIRRVVLKTSRKSGKTLLASVLGLTEVLHGNEARAQVLMLAAQRDQSRLAYNNAKHMILADPVLESRFKITDFQHIIRDKVTHAELRALSTEASQIIGWGPSVAIVDELHLLGLLGQKGQDLVHGLESGMMARAEPLLVYITTAPVREARGIYSEVIDHARKVAAGEVDDRRTLALLYEGAEESDPSTWWRSNPNLGVTIQRSDLEEQHRRAEARGADARAEFLSQNLNIDPEDRSSAAEVWIDLQDWAHAEDDDMTRGSLLERADQVVVGIDVGGASDLTAVALLGRDSATQQWMLWTHCWLSRRGYRAQVNTTPFADALAAGGLTVVERLGDDVDAVVDLVQEAHAAGKLAGVGCDAAMMKEPSQRIEETCGVTVFSVPQGWRLSPYLDSFERALLSGRIRAQRNPLMRWCLGNAWIAHRGEARALVKPEETEDSPRKIDPVVAMVCAWAVVDAGEVRPSFDVAAMIGGLVAVATLPPLLLLI